LHKEVLHLHSDRSSDAGEGIDHEADERPIAQAGKGSGVDRVDQGTGLVHIEDWRFALPLGVLRPAHGVGRVRGENLAHYHPIEEHPQRGQPLLDRGLGMLPELVLDEGGDVDRLDLGEILDAKHSTERGELPDRFHVGAAGVLVADVGAEEVAHPRPGFRSRREDRGYRSTLWNDGDGPRCVISHGGNPPMLLKNSLGQELLH